MKHNSIKIVFQRAAGKDVWRCALNTNSAHAANSKSCLVYVKKCDEMTATCFLRVGHATETHSDQRAVEITTQPRTSSLVRVRTEAPWPGVRQGYGAYNILRGKSSIGHYPNVELHISAFGPGRQCKDSGVLVFWDWLLLNSWPP